MKNNPTIAFIVNRVPSLESGGEVRNYSLINSLKRNFELKFYFPTFHKVHFLNSNGDVKFFERVLFTLMGKLPYIEKLRRAECTQEEVRKIKNADLVHVAGLEAYFTIEKYFENIKGVKILDTHNIDYIRFISEIEKKGFLERHIELFLGNILKNLEIKIIKKFDKVLVCSEVEKKYFSQFINSENVIVIPNGAQIQSNLRPKKINKNQILFMGLLGYQPNADGLKYYLDNIYPTVVKDNSKANLVILGKNAPEWLKEVAKDNPQVTLLGFVDDVRKYIASAAICICPLLSGSGTRLKILEYMAMGKPVVSTTIGAEGIMIKDGYDILLADTPNLFAAKINKLFKDNTYAEKLGKNAKRTITVNYSWDTIGNKLIQLYQEELKSRPTARSQRD